MAIYAVNFDPIPWFHGEPYWIIEQRDPAELREMARAWLARYYADTAPSWACLFAKSITEWGRDHLKFIECIGSDCRCVALLNAGLVNEPSRRPWQ